MILKILFRIDGSWRLSIDTYLNGFCLWPVVPDALYLLTFAYNFGFCSQYREDLRCAFANLVGYEEPFICLYEHFKLSLKSIKQEVI